MASEERDVGIAVLLAHVASTLFLTGTVWFAQVVHFPLFAKVGEEAFPAYIDAHYRAFGWVIWPVLAVNLVTLAALLLGARPPGLTAPLVVADLVVVLGTIASTFALQVPRLIGLGQTGFDAGRIHSLVVTNWARTGTQTAAALVVLVMVAEVLRSRV